MAEPLKNYYSKIFVSGFASICKKHIPNFSENDFIESIFTSHWEKYELKERMSHLTKCLHKTMNHEYSENIEFLINISREIRKTVSSEANFEYIFLTDYCSFYGLDDFETSMYAIEHLTQLASAEFAIRPFILKFEKQSMEQMLTWSKHKEHTVRRLSSEGCRPRLPWGMAFPRFKKDPSLILPILENLKDDPSLFVRKSVANNLNDISKDHPELVLKLCKKWHNTSENTNWITKHALRTLLKKGNEKALALFGYEEIEISSFTMSLDKDKLSVGEKLSVSISFKLKEPAKIRLEYELGFQTKLGKPSNKVFQISEKEYKEGKYSQIVTHTIQNLTTRKIYSGKHTFRLIVNGKRLEPKEFLVL